MYTWLSLAKFWLYCSLVNRLLWCMNPTLLETITTSNKLPLHTLVIINVWHLKPLLVVPKAFGCLLDLAGWYVFVGSIFDQSPRRSRWLDRVLDLQAWDSQATSQWQVGRMGLLSSTMLPLLLPKLLQLFSLAKPQIFHYVRNSECLRRCW
jgi:hypothetical protein